MKLKNKNFLIHCNVLNRYGSFRKMDLSEDGLLKLPTTNILSLSF
jgi:uncharacterized membrane protein YobD (UPF0266 family)